MILGYFLVLDETEETNYAVMRQDVDTKGKLRLSIERENCTLAQARERLVQLYRTKPPEGVT